MSSRNSLQTKRINKDIEEISLSPIEGIGIISIDDNPMKYIVNMCLMEGIYKGYCIQLMLTLPNDYPLKPPTVLIYPKQLFDERYHNHIVEDNSKDENGMNFKRIKFDILENDSYNENETWNSSISLRSLLVKIQKFLSEPDFPDIELPDEKDKKKKKKSKRIPDKEKINQLMKSMDNYERTFLLKEKKGITKKVHTWKNPYPEIHYFNKDEEKSKQEIKENLSCIILRTNYIDNPDNKYLYPIIQIIEPENKKIKIYPIPEFLSNEAFDSLKIDTKDKLLSYYNINIKDESNTIIDIHGFPVFLDENHYSQNKNTILKVLNEIKYGNDENMPNPGDIFEIFSSILNKIISGIIIAESTLIKSKFIKAYFQYFLLFRKLSIDFDKEYIEYLNKKINLIFRNKYNVKKSFLPDLVNFFTILYFCDRDINNDRMKEIWLSLYEEFLTRQMFWIFHNGHKILKILEKIDSKELESDYSYSKNLEILKKEVISSSQQESFNLVIKDNKDFIEELKNEGIFGKVIEIIMSDDSVILVGLSNKKSLKKNIISRMNKNFQELFEGCSNSIKSKLYDLFSDNANLMKCVELKEKFKKQVSKKQEDSYKEVIHNLKVDKLIYDDKYKKTLKDFLKESFKSQRSNMTLMINYFISKLFKENNLMKELEKNYGVYLDIDKFMKEFEKISSIDNYKSLYEYIGSEFGTDKDDIELIKNAYEKAKIKKYVQSNEDEMSFSSHSSQSIRIDYIRGLDSRINFNNKRNYNTNEDDENRRENNSTSDNREGRGRGRGGEEEEDILEIGEAGEDIIIEINKKNKKYNYNRLAEKY